MFRIVHKHLWTVNTLAICLRFCILHTEDRQRKTTVAKNSKKANVQSNRVSAGAALLIGGALLGIIGNMQTNDNVKLLLVGFASALLVIAGVVLGMAVSNTPKKKK